VEERQTQANAKELEYARLKIRLLEERLRLERIAKYGKRSEKLSDLQIELLDLEPGVSSEEVADESEHEPITAQPEDKQQDKPEDKSQGKERRKHPDRQTLPSHLDRVEQIVACTAEQCACGQCGKQTEVIGYEETEVLDVKPAEYFVTVVKREKRACKSCEEQGVRTVAVPERIAPKSLLSDQLILDIVVAKYCESMPLYRQQAAMKRDAGVVIALSTIHDAVMRVGELLMAMACAMKRELLADRYNQADETPSACRCTTSADAIIKFTCGNMARLARAWCSTSAWAATAMDRSSPSASSSNR
jgi:transposase